MEGQQQVCDQGFDTDTNFSRRFGNGVKLKSTFPCHKTMGYMGDEIGGLDICAGAVKIETETRPGLLHLCNGIPASGVAAAHAQQNSMKLKDSNKHGSSPAEAEGGKRWVSYELVVFDRVTLEGKRREHMTIHCDGCAWGDGNLEIADSKWVAQGAWYSGRNCDLSNEAASSLLEQLRGIKVQRVDWEGCKIEDRSGVIAAIMAWVQARNRDINSQLGSPCVPNVAASSSEHERKDGSTFGSFQNVGSDKRKELMHGKGSLSMLSCQGEDDGHNRNRNMQSVFGQDGKAVSCERQGWMLLTDPETTELQGEDRTFSDSAFSQADIWSLSPEIESLTSPSDSDYVAKQEDVRNVFLPVSPPLDFATNEDSAMVRLRGGASAAHSCTVPEITGSLRTYGSIGPNPFSPDDPFRLCPPCAPPADFMSSDFTSIGMHGYTLCGENTNVTVGTPDWWGGGFDGGEPSSLDSMVTAEYEKSDQRKHLGASDRPNQQAIGRKPSWSPLRAVDKQEPHAKSKCNKASSRLARKNKMDQTRRTSLFHANRKIGATTKVLCPRKDNAGVDVAESSSSKNNSGFGSHAKARKRQRTERNHLQFLLQKELRPSDVGTLGRVVIPKKDAEAGLPKLTTKEGIQLDCEDYDTEEKFTLRFKYWPNNKSRMYVLENTGDFVKTHQLRESDKLLMYKSTQLGTKQGIYIVRSRLARDGLEDEEPTEDRGEEITDNSFPGDKGPSSPQVSNESLHESSLSEASFSSEVYETSDCRREVRDRSGSLHRSYELRRSSPIFEEMQDLLSFPSLEVVDIETLGF